MIYFTSDQHFGHKNVIKYCQRPYNNVEEMNEDIITRWNSVVTIDDTVYILGDFSLSLEAVESIPHRLNGNKFLIPGNHDHCHSYHKKSRTLGSKEKWVETYCNYGFRVLKEQETLMLDGLGLVNLCHHPYITQYEKDNDDKYEKWRPVDDKLLLCGHVHEKWKTYKSLKGTLMINVGVDVNMFTPISLDRIIELVELYY